MNTKSFHKTKRAWNCTIRHDPHSHMYAFGRECYEVPEIGVGCLCLRKTPVRRLFGCVDQIRKFNSVLDEENGNIIANNVPVAPLGIKLNGESSNITGEVC